MKALIERAKRFFVHLLEPPFLGKVPKGTCVFCGGSGKSVTRAGLVPILHLGRCPRCLGNGKEPQ